MAPLSALNIMSFPSLEELVRDLASLLNLCFCNLHEEGFVCMFVYEWVWGCVVQFNPQHFLRRVHAGGKVCVDPHREP